MFPDRRPLLKWSLLQGNFISDELSADLNAAGLKKNVDVHFSGFGGRKRKRAREILSHPPCYGSPHLEDSNQSGMSYSGKRPKSILSGQLLSLLF
jgi:hypothetical protein